MGGQHPASVGQARQEPMRCCRLLLCREQPKVPGVAAEPAKVTPTPPCGMSGWGESPRGEGALGALVPGMRVRRRETLVGWEVVSLLALFQMIILTFCCHLKILK